MKSDNMKKFAEMKDADLHKEVASIRATLLQQRIDISNQKLKNIGKIKENKKNIARIYTILSAREEENSNE